MPLTNAAVDSLLDLLFNNVAWSNIGDSAGLQPSGAAGVFYLSLHNGSPGLTGNQTTNETSYGGYSRISVVRTSAGWIRTAEIVNPAYVFTWPTCTGGTDTITYIGIGTASSGSGHLVGYASVSPSIAVSTSVVPQATTASTLTFT
jgi:hypothetical protein